MNRILRKMIMNGIVVVPLLMWFTEATLWSSLVVAVVLSLVAYIVGDQLILRRTSNTVATMIDAGLAFAYFWVVADWMDWSLSFGELIVLTLALGVVEFIYHRQLEGYDSGNRGTVS
jgi:hypothetical protein